MAKVSLMCDVIAHATLLHNTHAHQQTSAHIQTRWYRKRRWRRTSSAEQRSWMFDQDQRQEWWAIKKEKLKNHAIFFAWKWLFAARHHFSHFLKVENKKPRISYRKYGANNGCSFKLLTPCRFRTSSSSNELKYEFQPTPSINALYDPVDHGSAPKKN